MVPVGYPKGTCGQENCPSTSYHIEEGQWFCDQGHLQLGSLVVGEDEDDYGREGKTTRKQKKTREKVYRHLRGRKAFELYLYSYQLILWKQTHFLINTKKLPSELETLVKDLWTLRLQNLAYRVDDDGETDNETQSQMFSSQSEGETETEGERVVARKGLKKDGTPRLIETLALCYLGTVLLRLSYTPGDFSNWATKGELLYYGALKELPTEMKEQLPGTYHNVLTPTTTLKPGVVERTVAQLIILYQRDWTMSFPELNAPPLIYRFLRELSLPLAVYEGVIALMKQADYTFSYPTEIGKRQHPINSPEVQMVALVVVATKLFFPFDGVKRYPTSLEEPAAMAMDWPAWASIHFPPVAASNEPLTFEDMMNFKIEDVPTMSNAYMDAYMDFAEKMFIDDEPVEKNSEREFRRWLDETFTSKGGASSTAPAPAKTNTSDAEEPIPTTREKLMAVMSKMKPQKEISEEEALTKEVLRPGSHYRIWSNVSDLDKIERLFCEKAAKISGLSLSVLVRAVFLTEKRINRHQRNVG